jgi:hypothetical protein
MSRNLGALTLLDPSGPAWPVMGVLYPLYMLTVAQLVTELLAFYCSVYASLSKKGIRGNIEKIENKTMPSVRLSQYVLPLNYIQKFVTFCALKSVLKQR